jgi:hypothetical protein
MASRAQPADLSVVRKGIVEVSALADSEVRGGDAAVAQIKAQIGSSVAQAAISETPYRHWTLENLFPDAVVDALFELPFNAPALDGISGERELHNDSRTYFDQDNIERRPVCAAVAKAFHDPDTVQMIADATGSDLDGCYLRIEFAQDVDGFWLRPHTDLGVKRLTLLYYLAEPGQEDLGTDIYAAADSWAKRAPFKRNEALMFVPNDHTWHGFEPRRIEGVRKSVIVNYVTDAWRDREQLAYNTAPVRSVSRARTA